MKPPARQAAELAARILEHPVPVAVPAADGHQIAAASVAGDPPRARLAWVRAGGEGIVARVSCPPGRPSRWRPVVAASVRLEVPSGPRDHVLVTRLAPEASAMRPILASEDAHPPVAVGDEGLALARLPADAIVIAVDALDARGEPVGQLARAGISELHTDGAGVSGRMGATHGMAAGVGGGRWAPGLRDAAFELGYEPWLPAWVPRGLTRGRPRVEPDVVYPAAPPALVVAWTGEDGARVLLRQAPAPLASPDPRGRGAREVPMGADVGILRGRGLVTLVWETPERAFGLQVRGIPEGEAVALRVGRSIASEVTPG